MKILITGGAGYLGSVLTPTLLAQGHEVTVLDNFYFNQNSLMDVCGNEKFSVVRGDCREESVVKPLIAKHDLIIPLAALVGVPLCNTDTLATTSTNQTAVEMICRLASKQQWVIMPVTNSGYGVGEKGKFCTEETPLRPLSTYGVTKVKAEEAVLDEIADDFAGPQLVEVGAHLGADRRRRIGVEPRNARRLDGLFILPMSGLILRQGCKLLIAHPVSPWLQPRSSRSIHSPPIAVT